MASSPGVLWFALTVRVVFVVDTYFRMLEVEFLYVMLFCISMFVVNT